MSTAGTELEVELQSNYRVLSIQSHTVSSYCGNKSATFPLQTLGFDVDSLNTVQFSNHTAYPYVKGSKLTADDVQALFDGLEMNGLMNNYTHILTGYIGNYAILENIENMIKKLKSNNPNIKYICDTVMGDNGKLYVAPEIVPLYRQIIQYADIITPNQFEAEILSEIKIDSLKDTCHAAKLLHGLGTKNIVITSLSLPLSDIPKEVQTESSTNDSLYCFTSQILSNGEIEQYLIAFPTYKGSFSGTGDLFAALVVAWSNNNETLINAVYKVVCSVNYIAKMTSLYQAKYLKSDASPSEKSRVCELRLIQGKKAIEEPEKYASNDITIFKI